MKLYQRKKMHILAVLVCLSIFCGGCKAQTDAPPASDGLSVVATMFPPYDIARSISGGTAEIELLVSPGGDTHSYEPGPSDIAKISDADIFFYTGDVMEPWVPKLLAGIDAPNLRVVDLSAGIELHETAMNDGHDHGSIDPHIWTSPVIMQKMLETACTAFKDTDSKNAELYEKNCSAALADWQGLDKTFRDIVSTAARKDFIFGSRFACTWFAEEYGLSPDSPYASCSGETEPGVRDMARVIDYVKNNHIPVIYHQELTDDKTARAVAEATGAKLLLFHSCHNVSKEEFEQGVTCVSLMQQNAINLKEGLN